MILNLSELRRRNPWWDDKDNIRFDKYVLEAERSGINWIPKIFNLDELERDAIYTLRGPRQVGKTTYIKLLIKELLNVIDDSERILYLSCDPIENFGELRVTLLNYLNWVRGLTRKRIFIFLDEVTRIKDWQIAIKDLYDHGYLENTVILATGSHSLDVIRGGELLPGRRGNYVPPPDRVLLPMSFKEFLEAYNINLFKRVEKIILKNDNIYRVLNQISLFLDELSRMFDKYLITGGFPKPISLYKKNSERGIPIYPYNDIKYYIRGDILRAGKNPDIAVRILNKLIEKLGTPIGYNTIAKDLGVDPKTVKEYIDVLRGMYLLVIIQQVDIKNLMPLERKMKKIYHSDPFIIYVSKYMIFEEEDPYSMALELKERIYPKLIELVVANHLKRLNMKMFYWRTKKKREIDFLVITKQKNIGIEVKSNISKADVSRVAYNLQEIPIKGKKIGIVTGKGEEIEFIEDKFKIPVEVFLLLLEKIIFR